MLSYYTDGINNPWTLKDVEDYERNGSQRDKVIYNSFYNSRLILTDENIYLYSSKHGSQYRNFYILGKTRSLFYIMFYVPQLDFLNDSEITSNQFIKECLSKLPLLKCALESVGAEKSDLNTAVSIFDGTCFLVEVNANIGELLFPKYNKITNAEILRKIALMNKIYVRCLRERDVLLEIPEKYKTKQKEKMDHLKSRLTKIIIKKGVKTILLSSLGIPPIDLFEDLDTLFNLTEIVEVANTVDVVDIMTSLSLNDLEITDF